MINGRSGAGRGAGEDWMAALGGLGQALSHVKASALKSYSPAHVRHWILGQGLGGHTAWAEQGPPGLSNLGCLLLWVMKREASQLGLGWGV